MSRFTWVYTTPSLFNTYNTHCPSYASFSFKLSRTTVVALDYEGTQHHITHGYINVVYNKSIVMYTNVK